MSDELDDVLRRTMKTLDDQVPSGYFDHLPNRTLARLGNGSMQTTGPDMRADTDVEGSPQATTGVPPVQDEDSGLHDIRSLASSTKARLSSRRSSQNPILSDDALLASSSAGWKAVALPEPAKMVSLPPLESLPSEEAIQEPELDGDTAQSAAARAPAVGAAFGARIAAQHSGGKAKLFAVGGAAVAAAAGVGLYFAMSSQGDTSTLSTETTAKPARVVMPALAQAPVATPSQMKPAPPVAAPPVAAAAEPPPSPPPVEAPAKPAKPAKSDAKDAKPKEPHKVEVKHAAPAEPAKPAPPTPTKVEETKPAAPSEGEPSFDALLKEAGVNDDKAAAKPKLDKKSLSSADIKTGMTDVAAKAQACYAGQQGTASLKLTVAPSGKVQKATVTGVFAGTPVGACVEAAVKSATFAPWDGGPQSFGYSYLLSE